MNKVYIDNKTGWFWRWRPGFLNPSDREIEFSDEESFPPAFSFGDIEESNAKVTTLGRFVIFLEGEDYITIFDSDKKRNDLP